MPEKIFGMEAVHDKDIKLLHKYSVGVSDTPARLLYRGMRYLMLQQSSYIYVWSLAYKTSYFDDESPVSSNSRNVDSKPVHPNLPERGEVPHIVLGPSFVSCDRKGMFHSVIVSLTGSIRCFDVIRKSSRVALALVTEGGSLTILTDSCETEKSPYGPPVPIFRVDLFFQLHLLDSPGSVNFWSCEEGESVFITDSTDRVCEVRFDHSILLDPRMCPEVSVVYWTLESRMGIADNCQVSIVSVGSAPPQVQIVGLLNNANSQGVVALVNSRQGDDFFALKSLQAENACLSCGSILIVNNEISGFRIMNIDNLDFPRFIRPALARVELVNNGQIFCENSQGKTALFDPLIMDTAFPSLPSMSVSSEDWEAEQQPDGILVLSSLAFANCRFDLVSSDPACQPSFCRLFNHLVLCWGDQVYVKQHLRYRGIVWTQSTGSRSKSAGIMTISESGNILFVLNRSTGQVRSRPIPPDLLALLTTKTRVALDDPFSLFHESVLYMYGITLELPLGISPEVLGLIQPSADLNRCCDFAGRRYLLAWTLLQTTCVQDLAWARASKSRIYLMQQVCASKSFDYATLQRSGMPMWVDANDGEEMNAFRSICERIQKDQIIEYMKNKDVDVLEKQVALWLAILGKQQMIATLYKSHGSNCASPVHTKVGIFLNTDFSIAENKTIGIRNAFELVKQKRNELAVAVFLLAGAVEEAVDICARTDWQLALLVAKLRANTAVTDKLWNNRICPDLHAAGDVWLDGKNKIVGDAVMHLLGEPLVGLGPIAIESQQVSGPSMKAFLGATKASAAEWAWTLHQTGLSLLARKLFKEDPQLPPALRWAINCD